jgi:hypothetical protein
MFKLSFWKIYYVEMCSPFILFGGILLGSHITDRLLTCTRKKDSTPNVQRRPSSSGSKEQYVPKLKSKVIHSFVFLLVSMYTFLATNAFSPFQCLQQPDGTYTLITDPSANCYDSTWYSNLAFVVFSGIFTVFVIPCKLFHVLYKNRDNLNSKEFVSRYGTLVDSYKPKFYYWELYNVLKKTLFSVLVNATNDLGQDERIFYVTIFLFVCLLMENILKPYKISSVNSINTV